MNMDAESPYRTRRPLWLEDPDTYAVEWGKERLACWLADADEGSVEEAVLAPLAGWPDSDWSWPTALGYFPSCEQAWARVSSLAESVGAKRSTEVPLRLPFALSQALAWFPEAAVMVPVHAPVRRPDARGARLAAQILDTFPDEDPRVRLRLDVTRATLLLRAGEADGHVLFAELARDFSDRWAPIQTYYETACDLELSDPDVWNRLTFMLRRAKNVPKLNGDEGSPPWDPEEAAFLAREYAKGRPIQRGW